MELKALDQSHRENRTKIRMKRWTEHTICWGWGSAAMMKI